MGRNLPDTLQIATMADMFGEVAEAFVSMRRLKELVAPTTFGGMHKDDELIVRNNKKFIEEFRDIGLLYKEAIGEGKTLSQSSAEAAKDYVDIFNQVAAETINEEDLNDLTECLSFSIEIFIEKAKNMQDTLKTVHLRLAVLAQKQDDECERIHEKALKLREEIRGDQTLRSGSAAAATALGVGGIFFLPLVVPAIGLLLYSSVLSAVVDDEEKSVAFKDDSHHSMRGFIAIVRRAEEITGKQVNYWEGVLRDLNNVRQTSHVWLKKPSSKALARKLSVQWKEVTKSYELCNSQAGEAVRSMEIYLRITE